MLKILAIKLLKSSGQVGVRDFQWSTVYIHFNDKNDHYKSIFRLVEQMPDKVLSN